MRLVQLLVAELARDEGISVLQDGAQFPVWTPYNAFDAAKTLAEALQGERAQE
ncbi:MAG TPA: hypothetical protein VGX70_22595 [Gemmataceae bacterium]|nr:hypothetical protein [Gemmataceae bacterium]